MLSLLLRLLDEPSLHRELSVFRANPRLLSEVLPVNNNKITPLFACSSNIRKMFILEMTEWHMNDLQGKTEARVLKYQVKSGLKIDLCASYNLSTTELRHVEFRTVT